jgi:hypothetical protein
MNFSTSSKTETSKVVTYHIDRSSFPGWDDFKCKVGIESDKDGLKIILTVVGDAQLGDFRSYQGVEAQHE